MSCNLKWETGVQLLARVGPRASISSLEPILFPNLQPKSVIEIYGKAGCGKTEFLYHFIARCILPQSWNGIRLDGIGTSVVFIDTDHHFNLLRLVALIEKRIHHANLNKSEAIVNLKVGDVLTFVRERLQLLHLIKCSSSEQLLITLCSLDKFLTSKTVSVILIDSISAFYWLDRMNFMDNSRKIEEYYATMVAILNKLIEDFNLVLIATKQALMKNSELENPVDKNLNNAIGSTKYYFMGKHWQKFVKYNLIVQKCADSKKTFVSISVAHDNTCKNISAVISDCGLEFPD